MAALVEDQRRSAPGAQVTHREELPALAQQGEAAIGAAAVNHLVDGDLPLCPAVAVEALFGANAAVSPQQGRLGPRQRLKLAGVGFSPLGPFPGSEARRQEGALSESYWRKGCCPEYPQQESRSRSVVPAHLASHL